MDFDQTQAISYSFEDESEDDSVKTTEKTPVAFLKVCKYKDLQEKEYPLFEGENIIGRHETCDICIPTKALSKQHSCIEIKGDSHFIYDKKSLNKTRRGKLFLTPEVRYELKTNDKVIFADVECIYRIIDKNKAVEDSGSETGSESMLNDIGDNKGPTTLVEDEYNDDSDASSDILQPTQCYQPTQLIKPSKTAGTLSFQVGSDEDSFTKGKSNRNIRVKDTPAQRKKPPGKRRVLTPDSETDDDQTPPPPTATLVFTEEGRSSEEDERLLNQPTQACVMDSETDNETDDEVSKDILNQATQRVGGTVIPESDDDETDISNIDMNAATQACHSLSDTDEDQQGATVAYTMDIGVKSTSKKSKQSTPIASLGPTVPYDMDADVSGVAETQSFMLDKDEELLTPIRANGSKNAASEQNNNLKKSIAVSEDEEEVKSDPIIPDDVKEEVLEEDPASESEEQDMSHLFIMPTLACDMDEDVTDEPMDKAEADAKESSDEGSTQPVVDMDATQVVEDTGNDDATQLVKSPKQSDATQKFSDETQKVDDATQKIGTEDATQIIGGPKKAKSSKKSTRYNDDATLVVEDTDAVDNATVAVDDATVAVDDATVAVDDATVAVDDATVAVDDATVAVDDASVAVDDATIAVNENGTDSDATQPLSETVPENAETVPVGMNDQTQLIAGTPDSEVSSATSADATQLLNEEDNSKAPVETVPLENLSSFDEPTQACLTPKKKGKGKGKGKKSKGIKKAKVILEEEEEKEDEEDKIIEEATQAYGVSPLKGAKSPPSEDQGLLVEDATQPYGQSPVKKISRNKTKGGKPVAPDNDEPTQVYGKSPLRTSTRVGRSHNVKKKSTPEEKIESNDSESSNDTLPVDEIEFVPESESTEEDKPPLIPIPSRSPHKSALTSPNRRSPSPSPSPKKVMFSGVKEASFEKQSEETTDEEFSPVIERIPNSSPKNAKDSTSVSKRGGRTRGKKSEEATVVEPKTRRKRGQPSEDNEAEDTNVSVDKLKKTKGGKKNRSAEEDSNEEVKTESGPRSRRGRKSEVKMDVVETEPEETEGGDLTEEETKVAEVKTDELTGRSRRGKKAETIDEVKPAKTKVEQRSRGKKPVLKDDDDKSEVKGTAKPTKTSRTADAEKTEVIAESVSQTKLDMDDEESKNESKDLKLPRSTKQVSSHESEIEQSSGKTTRGKGKTSKTGPKSQDTVNEQDSVEDVEAVVETNVRQSRRSTTVKPNVITETVSTNKGRASRSSKTADAAPTDTAETIPDASRTKRGRRSAVVPDDSAATSTPKKENEGIAESAPTEGAEIIPDASRAKRGRRSAVVPDDSAATSTPKKGKEEIATENSSLEENPSQPKSSRGKRADKKKTDVVEEPIKEVLKRNAREILAQDIPTSDDDNESTTTSSQSKRKAAQNITEKDSVSDNKKKKISDSESESVHTAKKSMPASRKGRGAKNSNTSLETEQSSSIEDTNPSSSSRRTPKRGRGDGDHAKDEEVSASALKVSKKGDNSAPPTPSRKRLSQDVTASPSLRRKSFGIKPKVMFTGVVDEQGERIIKDLGGSMAETIQECTHLITDKIRRTVKLLGGISLGIQIITRQWLDDSKQAGMFLDSSKYILCDKTSEKQYKFSLRHSIEIATQSSMLEGYKIHVTKSVKPPPDTMAEILECSGAQVLKSLPKKKEDNMLVISCDEDKILCQPAISNGIDIMSSEFILTGLLRQQIDLQSFRLFGENTNKTPVKSRSRKR